MIRCECQKIDIAKIQWKKSGINTEQTKFTFGDFVEYNKTAAISKETAIAYYKDFNKIRHEQHNSIMLCGQVGSGKTHLSIALALNFLQRKISVVYMQYRQVITALKQNMLDKEYYQSQVGKYQTAEILLIDDLYKGKILGSDINIMFEIINYRYLNHLPIIVSTEFTIDKMLSFDEGTSSRIYEMCKDYTVQIEGQENNYRLREE